jgi:ATP-dependent 26S proteasome regulatory subunit
MYKETITVLVENLALKDETEKAMLRGRLTTAMSNVFREYYKIEKPTINILPSANNSATYTNNIAKQSAKSDSKKSEEEEAFSIPLQTPQYTFDQLILEEDIINELLYSIKLESVKDTVYKSWGLEKIEPNPKSALNFWGDSGTGKTMAAHAIAHKMGKKIILASYAEIESKYHGDGPKNVKKLFNFAKENDAVLFIDEADSLLSKRLTNVTQGSEQAINSMRSQLLIQIEQYSGMVIFATNLASNYDKAFVTRIKSIHFKKPNLEMRIKLWEKMLLPTLPLDSDVNAEKLAQIDNVCGRDIKNAIVKAAIKTAIDKNLTITQSVLENSIKEILESNEKITGKPLSEEEKKELSEKIKRKLAEKSEINNC